LVPGQPQSAVYMLAEKISAQILSGLSSSSSAGVTSHMKRLDDLHNLVSA